MGTTTANGGTTTTANGGTTTTANGGTTTTVNPTGPPDDDDDGDDTAGVSPFSNPDTDPFAPDEFGILDTGVLCEVHLSISVDRFNVASFVDSWANLVSVSFRRVEVLGVRATTAGSSGNQRQTGPEVVVTNVIYNTQNQRSLNQLQPIVDQQNSGTLAEDAS